MSTNFGQAGTAFILLEADWKGFSASLKGGNPAVDTAATQVGKKIGEKTGTEAGKTFGQKFSQGLTASDIGRGFTQIGNMARDLGKTLTVAVTAPIAAVAGLGIAFNAMQEQAQISFTTLLGSADKATAFLSNLKDFAARTPFEFPGLVKASQRLLAMGFAADRIIPTLTSVGNAASALGGSQDVIDRITLALGQMQGRGKVLTQEMNQLTEVGVPAWRMLAEAIGVSETRLRDMVERGLVPADAAVQAFTDGFDKNFGGMMEKQAKTFTGLMSTIKDESRFVAGELTEGLFNVIKPGLENLVELLSQFRERLEGMSDSTKTMIAVGAGLAAAAGPALYIFGKLAGAVGSIIDLGVRLTPVLARIIGPAGFEGVAAAAAPVVVVLGKIALVLGALYIGKQIADWIGLTGALKGAAGWLLEVGDAVNDLMLDLGGAAFDFISESVLAAVDALKVFANLVADMTPDIAFKAWESALRGFAKAVDIVYNALQPVRDTFEVIAGLPQRVISELREHTDPGAPGADFHGPGGAPRNAILDEANRINARRTLETLVGPAALAAQQGKKGFGLGDEGGTKKADPVDQLVKSVMKEEEEASNLEKALAILESRNVSAEAIFDKLGNTIKDVADETALLGGTLGPLTEKYNHLLIEKMRQAEVDKELTQLWEEAGRAAVASGEMIAEAREQWRLDMQKEVEVTEEARDAQLKLIEATKTAAMGGERGRETTERMREMRQSIEDTTRAVEHFRDQGWTADQLLEEFGSDIRANAEFVKTYGGAISETEMDLLRFEEATLKAQARTEDLQDAWGNAFGGIVDGLVDMISNFDFSMKSLKDIFGNTAKDMLGSFLKGFFQPVKDEIAGFGRDLAGDLAKAVFGGPEMEKEGGGGGLLGGLDIGGMIGGLFGKGKKGKPSQAEQIAGLAGMQIPGITGIIGGGGGAAAGAAAAGAGGGLLSSLGGLGGIADFAGLAINQFSKIGAGRRAADEVVKLQQAFEANALRIADAPIDAETKSSLLEGLFSEFQAGLTRFAGTDPNNIKVANQALAGTMEFMTARRLDLAPFLSEGAAGGEFGPFAEATEVFRGAVDVFAAMAAPNLNAPTPEAMNLAAAASGVTSPSGATTVVAPEVHFDINVEAASSFDMTRLKQWVTDNVDGITAAIIQGIRKNDAGVLVT